jgi:hypothetical protein
MIRWLLCCLFVSSLTAAPVGDGVADDTEALQALLEQGGSITLARGSYRLSKSLEVDLAKVGFTAISGSGVARLIMAGAGPAIHFKGSHEGTANPTTVKPQLWEKERTPMLSDIEIVGDHAEAEGVQATGTMQLTVSRVSVRKARHGVHLTVQNRNIILSDCHIYECTGSGVFYDAVDLHQSNIVGCHISYNAGGGVVSRGGNVRNVHIGSCDIEGNHSANAPPSANIDLDSTGGSIGEVAITGCTIQHSSKAKDSVNIRIRGAGTDPSLLRRSGRETTREGNITITGNVFSDVQFNLDIADARGVVITGNTLWEGFQYDARILSCEQVILANNNFDRNPRYLVNGFENAERNGLLLQDCKDCSVTGNVISGVQRQRAAVDVVRGRRLRICDNTIVDSDGHGLLLEDCQHCMVRGNIIRDDRDKDARGKGLSLKTTGGEGNLVEDNLLGAP